MNSPSFSIPMLTAGTTSDREPLVHLLAKIVIMMVFGQFTFSIYSIALVLPAAVMIAGLFFVSLYREHYFSFLMQLFICNHFMFGYESGGIYNALASFALIAYLIFYPGRFQPVSSGGKLIGILLPALAVIQVLSVLNNESAFSAKLGALFVFGNILFLFYYTTKIRISADDYISFVKITCLFTLYSFCAALNQKFTFFQSPFFFFPSLDPEAEYEYGIPRSIGTLSNFEFYAEYSLGLIALLTPAILSGSASRYNSRLSYLLGLVVFVNMLAIILSGTRSSMLLLPMLILLICFALRRRLSFKIVFSSVSFLAIFLILNLNFKFIDLDVFSKRSQGVDMKKLTFAKIISGEEMNRGSIFAYGIKKAGQSALLYGEGYFSKRSEYVKVHFDNEGTDAIPDYHNLYMSAIVIWGYLGAILFVSIFIVAVIRAIKLYRRIAHMNHFLIDLLLGFTFLFVFLLINQFKIEFIRDTNYFMLILILLAVYMSLINLLSGKFFIVKKQ
jgi:O-antigen ligase